MYVEILHFVIIMAVVVAFQCILASVEIRLVTALNSGSIEDGNEDGDEDYLNENFDFDAFIASSDSEDSDISSPGDSADNSDPGNLSSGMTVINKQLLGKNIYWHTYLVASPPAVLEPYLHITKTVGTPLPSNPLRVQDLRE